LRADRWRLSSVLLDIFGWWAVKWWGAPLAPMVMFSGILMAVSFGGSVFVSMFDLWLRPRGPKHPPVIVDHTAAPVREVVSVEPADVRGSALYVC